MRTIFDNMLFGVASVTLTAGLVAYADPSVASVPQSEVQQARVVYGDLDLQSAQGRATLNRRIAGAADTVCPNDGVDAHFGNMTCREHAIASAHDAVDAQLADAGTPAVPAASN